MKTALLLILTFGFASIAVAAVDVKSAFSDADISVVKTKYSFTVDETKSLEKMLKNELIEPTSILDVVAVYKKMLTPLLESARQQNGKVYVAKGSDLASVIGFGVPRLTAGERVKYMARLKIQK